MVFDVAVVHTCALDHEAAGTSGPAGVVFTAGCTCHAHGSPLQPEHCSCHGRTSEAGAVMRLVVPRVIAVSVLPAAAGHPRWAVRRLDHPPHLNG
jgi:hypothetical protein